MLLFMVAACHSAPQAPDPAPALSPADWVVRQAGTVVNDDLEEVSGLARSAVGTHLWAVEDGGNPAVLHALSPAGASLGAVLVQGVENVDWEDLASMRLDGTSYLVIADVGDNGARRDSVVIHVVPEPAIDDVEVEVAWSIDFTWEDGPRDCEAVAVDGEQLLLITKRDSPPGLYTLPVRGPRGVAQRAGVVTEIPGPTPRDLQLPKGKSRSMPTAMDISSDRLLLLTYKHAYLYDRGEGWTRALASAPRWIDLPDLKQAEAAALSADYGWITTEQRPAPLLEISAVRTEHPAQNSAPPERAPASAGPERRLE